MIGKTMKSLRTKKGLTAQELAFDIISPSQMSKVEKGEHVPSADNFLKLLFRLNVSLEEFYYFSDNDYIRARFASSKNVSEVLRKRDVKNYDRVIAQMDDYYVKFDDNHFKYSSCLLKAFRLYSIDSQNVEKVYQELLPIKQYLLSTNEWLLYELSLFNNIFFIYPIEDVIKMSDRLLKQIKSDFHVFKNDQITRTLLINLAVHTLSNGYYMTAYEFSSTAMSLPQSTQYLYENIFAKVINQVACFKLENGEFDGEFLQSLVANFKLMRLDELYANIANILTTHEITC